MQDCKWLPPIHLIGFQGVKLFRAKHFWRKLFFRLESVFLSFLTIWNVELVELILNVFFLQVWDVKTVIKQLWLKIIKNLCLMFSCFLFKKYKNMSNLFSRLLMQISETQSTGQRRRRPSLETAARLRCEPLINNLTAHYNSQLCVRFHFRFHWEALRHLRHHITMIFLKIPHTGDKASLGRCG